MIALFDLTTWASNLKDVLRERIDRQTYRPIACLSVLLSVCLCVYVCMPGC